MVTIFSIDAAKTIAQQIFPTRGERLENGQIEPLLQKARAMAVLSTNRKEIKLRPTSCRNYEITLECRASKPFDRLVSIVTSWYPMEDSIVILEF